MVDEAEIRPMWLIDIQRPWRGAAICEVEIRHGKNTVRGVAKNGRGFIYGSSMFGTREAAMRECYARMASYAADWYNRRFYRENVSACENVLADRKNYR